MFEIISLGRMDFLMAVLNGLAILTADDGPAGYGGLVGLGLLIGVLLAMVRGVVTQKLELQWVFAGWLLFTTLFVPKVDVTVEDIYTGETNTVANVPLGPAAIGSITSTIGITLAGAFETVFAYPSLTTAGYMDSLDLINAMREIDFGGANDGDASSAVANVDLQRSIREYLVRCVMQSISMGIPGIGPNWSNLRETDDLLAAIQVNTNIWTTTVYLDPAEPTGVAMGCGDAYTQIVTFIDDSFYPAWTTYIGAQLGLEDTEVQVQDSLDALFGLGADARNYMLNSLLKREIELADLGYHAGGGNDAGVLMRVQAMEQRRAQWAAEQSLWAEMARPAISFIEGFFYAASPFMGFMFCIGAPGITIFGRYLVFAVWIQLWMPILAVTNLYITIAAQNDLQRIQASGTNLLSMTGLESVWTETSSWLAFGGNMVAATPLLTFILLTGSYFALTRLTDRLGGADHVNERITSPDIVNPAPVASLGAIGAQAASFSADALYGLRGHGAEVAGGAVNLSSALSAAASSRASTTADSVHRLLQESSSGVDLSRKDQFDSFLRNSISESFRSGRSETDSIIRSMATQVAGGEERYRALSEQDRHVLDGAVALGLSGFGSGGRVNGMLQNASGVDEGTRRSWAESIQDLASSSRTRAVELARAIATDDQRGSSSSVMRALGMQDSERWSEGISATKSAVEAFDEVSTLQQSMGSNWKMDALAIGNQLSGTQAGGQLYTLATAHNMGDRVDEVANALHLMGVSRGTSVVAASARVLFEDGTPEAAIAAAQILKENLGAPGTGIGGGPSRGPTDGPPSPATAWKEMQAGIRSNVQDVPESANALRTTVEDRLGGGWERQAAEWRARGDAAVEAGFNAWLSGNQAELERNQQELAAISERKEFELVRDSFESERGFLQALNETAWARNLVNVGGYEDLKTAFGRADDRYKEAYDETYERTGSRLAAMSAGVIAAASTRVPNGEFGHRIYTEAYSEAVERDIPEQAAHYFAALRASSYYTDWDRDFEDTEEYADVRREAVELMGEQGVAALERAAAGTDVVSERYLKEAAVLGKGFRNN